MRLKKMSRRYLPIALVLALMVAASTAVVPIDAHADDARAQAYFEQGRSQLKLGNVGKAELLFAQAMQQAPNDLAIAMALSELYISQHRFDDAAALIEKSRVAHSTDYRVWRASGLLAQARGDSAQAIADFERAFTAGAKEDRYVVTVLQQYYEQTGDEARRKQMENNLQWLDMQRGSSH